MRKPANNSERRNGLHATERAAMEAETARVKAEALSYRGRPDLLDLALGVVAELTALNRELVAAYRAGRPAWERQALLDRERAKAREYVVIEMAMDGATRAAFEARIGAPAPTPPIPDEIVQRYS